MNLYLVQRTNLVDWDEYAGFVICADSPEAAREIAGEDHPGWGKENVAVRLIGVALDGIERGILLSDFNAWMLET